MPQPRPLHRGRSFLSTPCRAFRCEAIPSAAVPYIAYSTAPSGAEAFNQCAPVLVRRHALRYCTLLSITVRYSPLRCHHHGPSGPKLSLPSTALPYRPKRSTAIPCWCRALRYFATSTAPKGAEAFIASPSDSVQCAPEQCGTYPFGALRRLPAPCISMQPSRPFTGPKLSFRCLILLSIVIPSPAIQCSANTTAPLGPKLSLRSNAFQPHALRSDTLPCFALPCPHHDPFGGRSFLSVPCHTLPCRTLLCGALLSYPMQPPRSLRGPKLSSIPHLAVPCGAVQSAALPYLATRCVTLRYNLHGPGGAEAFQRHPAVLCGAVRCGPLPRNHHDPFGGRSFLCGPKRCLTLRR